jgi:hypothetical protein
MPSQSAQVPYSRVSDTAVTSRMAFDFSVSAFPDRVR